MHFVSYYCVQVLVLLACQLDFSYSVPIRPPSHFDLLIDPLHQSELEDLESKKIVPKSVLNVPYITPVQTVPSCPPGQTRLSGGPCVQRVVSTGLSDDQSLVAQLTKQYFKRKQPPKRQRHPTVRTTTQEPVPTTEVVTESSVSSKDLAATTAWTTASPTLTSTPKSQQEQAFTEEIMTSIPTTTVADKDVTTEQPTVEQTSLLNDLPIGTLVLAEDQTPQTTEPYSINDKTTLNYEIDGADFPSKISDESTFTATELPVMEIPKETTQYEESYERRTELPKEKEESQKELMEIPRATTTATSSRNETEGKITEPITVLPTVEEPSLNHSSAADVILSENSNPAEKINHTVETSSPFTTTEVPQESETLREETTPELISFEDVTSRIPVAPVMEQVEEFTTAIYLSQPALIPPLPYQPEMIFDFVPSPSDIYKPTMPPKYTQAPKLSFPLELSSSSGRSGRLDDDSQARRSSFISYDYFVGPQGHPRSNNFNPAYTFS